MKQGDEILRTQLLPYFLDEQKMEYIYVCGKQSGVVHTEKNQPSVQQPGNNGFSNSDFPGALLSYENFLGLGMWAPLPWALFQVLQHRL